MLTLYPPAVVIAALRGEPIAPPPPIPAPTGRVLPRALERWNREAPEREAAAARDAGRLRLEALRECTEADVLLQATGNTAADRVEPLPSDDHPRASAEVAGAESEAPTAPQSEPSE